MVASRYTGVFRGFLLNLRVTPGDTVMVVHRKMPSGGKLSVVSLVIFIGPYEPSLPELKLVCPEADNAKNMQSPASRPL